MQLTCSAWTIFWIVWRSVSNYAVLAMFLPICLMLSHFTRGVPSNWLQGFNRFSPFLIGSYPRLKRLRLLLTFQHLTKYRLEDSWTVVNCHSSSVLVLDCSCFCFLVTLLSATEFYLMSLARSWDIGLLTANRTEYGGSILRCDRALHALPACIETYWKKCLSSVSLLWVQGQH